MIGGSTVDAELATLKPWADRAPAITAAERLQRLAKAREGLAALGADALLVNAGPSLRYFTGVSWGATERLVALLLPVAGEPIMICPTFELGSLQAELAIAADIRLWEEDESPTDLVVASLPAGARLAVDPLLNFGAARRLGEKLPVVAGAVGKPRQAIVRPQPRLFQHHARGGVHAFARGARGHGVKGGRLRLFLQRP